MTPIALLVGSIIELRPISVILLSPQVGAVIGSISLTGQLGDPWVSSHYTATVEAGEELRRAKERAVQDELRAEMEGVGCDRYI